VPVTASGCIPEHSGNRGSAAGDNVRRVPTNSVHILTAPTHGEFEALTEIFNQYRAHYGEPSDGAPARRWLERCLVDGRLRAFVAEDKGEIVGFATATELPASLRLAHFWQIRDLFVLPTHRRLGVARALLACIHAAAIESGALRLAVQTEDDNHAALRLYGESGFALVNGYCSLTLPLGAERR
jgi:GNAT superfamily N-acetyltransferase